MAKEARVTRKRLAAIRKGEQHVRVLKGWRLRGDTRGALRSLRQRAFASSAAAESVCCEGCEARRGRGTLRTEIATQNRYRRTCRNNAVGIALVLPPLSNQNCLRAPGPATAGTSHSRSDGAFDTMTVIVATKKVVGRVLVGLAPRGGASSMRAASIGAVSALRPQQQCQSRTLYSKERSKSVYEYGAHRSDAEARIAEVPVVMVDGPVALCDGGACVGVGCVHTHTQQGGAGAHSLLLALSVLFLFTFSAQKFASEADSSGGLAWLT